MLQIVNGKLMNSRDIGNAVAELLLQGTPIDQISQIPGMPTPVQIAYMRRTDAAFADALQTAFEGAGIESAFKLMQGARTGQIGKFQVDAAKWVAERMAPELFQERKTITNEVIKLTDEELAAQLEAAARSDERVRKILDSNNYDTGARPPIPAGPMRKTMRELARRKRQTKPPIKVINPDGEQE